MSIKVRNDLTADHVRRLLDYDFMTGALTWRHNPDKPTNWNGRYPGAQAGRTGPKGAIQVSIDSVLYLAHRLVWLHVTGEWPDFVVDHINHDRSDNRFANLRLATPAENRQNLSGPTKSNRSGFLGVCFRPHLNKWMAYIHVGGRQAWRYYADTAEEAAEARRATLPLYHGAFAAPRDHR